MPSSSSAHGLVHTLASASRAETLVSPRVDAGLRNLASFWVQRRHVHTFFATQALSEPTTLLPEAPPHGVLNATTPGLSVEEQFPTVNHNPISTEPLFVVVGVGIALLITDFAFGHIFCRRATKSPEATPPKPSTPEISTPSTPEELKDAADEWEYFKRTKCRVLILSMVLGFASEFLLWMLAPFFPLEAIQRGVSTEVVGLVFACHPIALGVSSQISPWLMRNVSGMACQRCPLPPPLLAAHSGEPHPASCHTP